MALPAARDTCPMGWHAAGGRVQTGTNGWLACAAQGSRFSAVRVLYHLYRASSDYYWPARAHKQPSPPCFGSPCPGCSSSPPASSPSGMGERSGDFSENWEAIFVLQLSQLGHWHRSQEGCWEPTSHLRPFQQCKHPLRGASDTARLLPAVPRRAPRHGTLKSPDAYMLWALGPYMLSTSRAGCCESTRRRQLDAQLESQLI